MMRVRPAPAGSLEPRADMTPLIDVVFQILIFFLCTLHFRQLEGRLDAFLPRDVGGERVTAELDPLRIDVRVVDPGERRDPRAPERPWSGHGPFELVGRRLSYRLGPRVTDDLVRLRTHLAELQARDPARRLTLDAGPGTLQGDVLAVLDQAIDVGFRDVALTGAD